jgi:hypothetical protein
MRRDDRIRERGGRGSSVGGDPAKQALGALVQQFSQRSAFVRELVQNSLDAGSGRVELTVEQQGRRLRIALTDDGEGMDRATIEGYLLTLFRSSKEQDLTKIGKFGIGFVSLFAVEPELVVVDTARDGVHHRVIFDSDYEYTLAEVDEPFEGTRVTLFVRTWGDKARVLARELDDALNYWCRFAHAEVWSEGLSDTWGWPLTEVEHPFTVDAPVTVSVQEPGFRAVVGFAASTSPNVGYYNRGLTLLEGEENVLPGITFRVEAAHLEHTLTRDNVRRDAGFEGVIRRVRELALGPLRDKHVQAVQAAEGDRATRLLHAMSYADLGTDLQILRRANGGPSVSIDALRGGLISRLVDDDIVVAPGPSWLVEGLEAEGRIVLLDAVAENSWVRRHLPSRPILKAHKAWLRPGPIVPCELASEAGAVAAEFTGGGDALKGELCIRQRTPGALERWADRKDSGRVVVNVKHPLYRRCKRLGVDAAPYLKQAMDRWLKSK